MTRKNTLTCLDSHRQYAVIGLDLAKYDVSVAAIPVELLVGQNESFEFIRRSFNDTRT